MSSQSNTASALTKQWNGIMGGWVTQFPLGSFCSHILIKTRPLMVLDAQNTLPSTLFIALINWLWTITNITEHIAADNFPTSRGDTTGHNKMLFNYMFGLLLGWRGEVAFCAFCVMSLPFLLHQVFFFPLTTSWKNLTEKSFSKNIKQLILLLRVWILCVGIHQICALYLTVQLFS